MSAEKQSAQAQRWLLQAQDDLEAASVLRGANKFAQAAFYAQQSAEKGLKALWHSLDLEPWGHSVTRLIGDLPEGKARSTMKPLIDDAKSLDKHYIPARYPDAFPDLTPAEVYTQAEAQASIAAAKRLLVAVGTLIVPSP
jgi:HEPN domain-containing protein